MRIPAGLSVTLALFTLVLCSCSKLAESPGQPGPPAGAQAGMAITVKVSGTFGSVQAAGSPESLQAETDDPQGVLWTLMSNGVNCSPFCGTLDFSGGGHLFARYTPPPILAFGVSPDATIAAISATDASKSASFSFKIHTTHDSGYVFLLRGYDSSGNPLAMAGDFQADDDGNIKDGVLDINDGGTTTTARSLQGKFSTDTNFAGIIRGTITLTNFSFPGTSVNPVFKFVLRGNELEARTIEFDQSGNLVAGTVLLQSAASNGLPQGIYAFGLDSDAPVGQRTVEAGAFLISGDGSVTGVADQSQAGASNSEPGESLGGTATTPDNFGRGAVSFSINGTTTDYAYYLVDSGHLNLVQVGGGFSFGTVLSGTARARTLDFDPVNGVFQTSVVQLTGIENTGEANAPSGDAGIGVLSIAKDNSISLTYDANNAGTISVNQTLSGKLTSYDPNTGRGVLSLPGGFQGAFVDNAVFYLYDNGEGFIIDTDPSTTGGPVNRAFSGTLSRQIPGPYDNQSIKGQLIGISGAASLPSIPNVAAALDADSSSGALTGMAYATSVTTEAGQLANVTFQGTFSIADATTGRGNAMLPAGFYGDFTQQTLSPASFYLIGPNRFVSIGIQSGSSTGVSCFSPY